MSCDIAFLLMDVAFSVRFGVVVKRRGAFSFACGVLELLKVGLDELFVRFGFCVFFR